MAIDMNVFRGFAEQIKMLPQMAKPTDCPEDKRVERAKAVFAAKLDAAKATDLESCVHCGMCAEACQFYIETEDPDLTPIHKLDLLRRFYRREKAPMRFLHRLTEPDITEHDLRETQHLVYETCTECGRCGVVCPMGIDIASMVHVTRVGLAEAGLIPAGLRAVEQEQGSRGTVFGVGPEQLRAVIEELRSNGHDVPIDKKQADILVLTSTIDVQLFKDTLEATIKVMNHLGVDWTLHSCAFEGANFGLLSGYEKVQKSASERITDGAIALGAKLVIIPECGHAYPAMRWDGANKHGKPLPFEVMALSEFLGREVMAGRLQLEPIGPDKHVTYHDPCKVGRHGGVFDEPRAVLDALGVDMREMPANRVTNFCCGGGAGLFVMENAAPMRDAAFDLKRRQVEATGVDSVVTACGSCRVNLMAGAARTQWGTGIESLVEMVGNNLKTD